MNLPQIYKITNEFLKTFEHLQSMEEELTPQCVHDTLGSLTPELAKDLGAALKNVEYEIAAMKDYEVAMKARRESLQKRLNSFYEYLVTNMEKCGYTKLSCSEFDIILRSNPESVVIDKEGCHIPEKYFRQYTVREPNKIELKKALQSGGVIDGVKLVRKKKVIIK